MNQKYENPVPLWLINLTSFCVTTTLLMGCFIFYATLSIHAAQTRAAQYTTELPILSTLKDNPFDKVALSAKSAIVYNAKTGEVVYGNQEEVQLPLASLTKLMTALVAAETLPPFTRIAIVPLSKDADPRLRQGEQWSLEDLIAYTLISSSNSGAESIASVAGAFLEGEGTIKYASTSRQTFVDAMNQSALQLGLAQTYYLNSTGLDTNGNLGGAYGSAKDTAILFSYLLEQHPDLLTTTTLVEETFRDSDGRAVLGKNTNVVLSQIPGILGSKTGLTDLAGGNLVIAFDASFGEPFVVAVLGSTEESRFTDIQQLVNATIEYLGAPLRLNALSDCMPESVCAL